MDRPIRLLLVTAVVASAGPAQAEPEPEPEPSGDDAATSDDPADAPGEVIEFSSSIGTRSRAAIVDDHRAVTVVDREQLAESAPRSTSAALHLVPGVSVQSTNHAGGAPFLRGRTGQETLILVDGFRLNTSIIRSGPNQYLNTVDPGALDRIEVLRTRAFARRTWTTSRRVAVKGPGSSYRIRMSDRKRRSPSRAACRCSTH